MTGRNAYGLLMEMQKGTDPLKTSWTVTHEVNHAFSVLYVSAILPDYLSTLER